MARHETRQQERNLLSRQSSSAPCKCQSKYLARPEQVTADYESGEHASDGVDDFLIPSAAGERK
jgi:hypothetical protein